MISILSIPYKILKFIFKIALFIVLIVIILQLIANQSAHQKEFTAGKIPEKLPDGFHTGTAHILADYQTPWLGKFFDIKTQTGNNVFTPLGLKIIRIATPLYKQTTVDQSGNTHAYTFKYSTDKGIKDTTTNVIKLDYNLPENPWLIRPILDEIVQIKNDEYLGKIHIHLWKDHYITIGYFGLKK